VRGLRVRSEEVRDVKCREEKREEMPEVFYILSLLCWIFDEDVEVKEDEDEMGDG